MVEKKNTMVGMPRSHRDQLGLFIEWCTVEGWKGLCSLYMPPYAMCIKYNAIPGRKDLRGCALEMQLRLLVLDAACSKLSCCILNVVSQSDSLLSRSRGHLQMARNCITAGSRIWDEAAVFWGLSCYIWGVLGKLDSIMTNMPAVEGTGEQIEWLKANAEFALCGGHQARIWAACAGLDVQAQGQSGPPGRDQVPRLGPWHAYGGPG